jgi:hypothetical protein
MNTFLQLDKEEKTVIFEQIRTKTGLPIQAIEKDWWVWIVRHTSFLKVVPH